MDALDKVELLQDLNDGTLCDLNHGKGYKDEDILAIDYITIPLGLVKENKIITHIVLAVCEDCVKALQDPEWVLLVCKDCGQTRWVWRKYSKLDFVNRESGLPYKIILMEGCPDCTGKMEGIHYFQHDQFKGCYEVN